MVALTILTKQFEKGDEKKRKEIYSLYLKNTKNINNWDLVDLSCYKIVGPYLADRDKSILSKLARSKSLWERRIAMISTFHYIRQKKSKEALEIAEILVNDKEDLIHKAVGWMLREVGKRCGQEIEEKFLKKYYKTMPRTMLRYSIERFSVEKRKFYMNKS
jgi:3-methyladenine DNA glycosylase AlkD